MKEILGYKQIAHCDHLVFAVCFFMEGWEMLICVTDRKQCGDDFLQRVEDIARLGADKIILREKDLSCEQYEILAQQCQERCAPYGVPLVINTQVQVAQNLSIGQLHLPLPLLRQQGRPHWAQVLSTSVHSVEQAQEAQRLGVDMLIAGHIFATQCKAGLEPRGLEFLYQVCQAVHLPVYAIGGMTPERVADVWRAGAKGVCVMSGLMRCENIEKEMQHWNQCLDKISKV